MGGYAPRAPEDSVRPRRSSGVVVRPLNFTVRTHDAPCTSDTTSQASLGDRSSLGCFQSCIWLLYVALQCRPTAVRTLALRGHSRLGRDVRAGKWSHNH